MAAKIIKLRHVYSNTGAALTTFNMLFLCQVFYLINNFLILALSF